MKREEKLRAAADVGLFRGLPREQLETVAGVAERRRAGKGKIIFQAGDAATGFFAIVSGRVRIYRSAPNGAEHLLHVFGPGEAFAEIAVFHNMASYPADAQAMEDSSLLFFPRRAFKALLGNDPDLAMNMLALLSERLHGFVQKIEQLTLKETPARLAAHLLLLHEAQQKRRLVLDLSKGQLANYLGAKPETLSRILRKLADRDILSTSGGVVTLHDIKSLQRIAEGGKP